MPSTIHKLSCQGCGASLPVKAGTRLAVCEYCASQLEVVPANTSSDRDLHAKLDALKLREDLRDLDAAWEQYLAAVSTKDGRGALHPPSPGTAFGYAALGVIGTFVAIVALAQASYWTILGVVPVGFWITRQFWSAELKRFEKFDATRTRYTRRREELVREIGGPDARGMAVR
jgi:hypothetical protein